MNIADIFIRRPIMTSLVMIAILIFGVVSYRGLPVNDLPNVDFPTIQVNASLPGANPDTMAAAVATPLENQLSTIAGVDSMTSTNGIGSTRITLQFNLDRDIDAAAQDVQAAISLAIRFLPKNMPTPPSFRKVNPADQPVLYLALSSPTLPLSTVDEYAQTLIARRISTISGVAQVNVFGSQKYAVRAQLDPKALASRRIGIDEVATAIDQANVNLPTGTLDGTKQAYTIEASGQLFKAAAYRKLVVAYRDGSPVRLEELGTVLDSVENTKTASWYNGTRAIVLAVYRQPGTNTIEVVDRVRDLLPGFRSQIPASVDLNVLYDRSTMIRESMHDVKFTLVLTIGLVIMVIFLFLRNLSATIIPSLALPMSIVGTFTVMHLLGFSLNNISMMALTLAVGYVVDDAIVMLENIVRHMEKGESAMEAAFKGSKEIGFTIISMTISLVAVFIPVLFMGGILGRLLHEFAITISAAILVSCFVSLTLTPMLCSRFLKPPATEHHGRLFLVMERFFDGMLHLYERSLKRVLHYRRTVMAVTIVLTLFTGWLFTTVPKGFLPTEDTGRLNADTETAQGTSFADMKLHQEAVAAIIAKDPNIEGFMSSIGSGGGGSSNTGRLFMRLKPREERKLSADEIIQELRPKLATVPGIRVFLKNVPSIQIGGTSSKSQYQFTLQGQDTDELYRSATEFEAKLRELPELLDVTSDLQISNPQVHVDINRDKVAALGLSVLQVEDALSYAYGSRQVSSIFAPTNQYQVIMELDPLYQGDPAALGMLYIRGKTDQLVPLETIATISKTIGPLAVNHLGQLPAVTISFNLRPGVALGDAMKLVDKLAGTVLPPTVSTSFQGTAQAFKSSFSGLWLLLAMAIFVIYVVLGVLYESYIHPITILSGLPAAGFGALITLMAFKCDLNIYAFVGIIMLIGIVKKNAIMMIDFALEAERTDGKCPLDAIYEGAMVRFRPIMMTTMAALMGTIPIALGLGAGGESRQPLGLAVVGGLLTSQLLTLYITPVVYYYMDRLLHKVRPRKAALPESTVSAGTES
ncbi:efflux RND transporter permease subunit [Geomobilimonas luticola]|uniref:Efflux RND transporter permease subunit n=1 Tax=Geomobilimonas luticola TaxID=1114878 RepID=A0ABS5SAR1_9BACT|nr:efflux RND transporter permease subunit [Geomobilimonas luticola]MBT0652459.1 efflux RND transporter permease subunit [Geomobilimonas luticola]